MYLGDGKEIEVRHTPAFGAPAMTPCGESS
jgi:hypothetical protein